MKKLMSLMALCVIMMVSCQKDNETPEASLDQLLSSLLNEDITTDFTATDGSTVYQFEDRNHPGDKASCRKISLESVPQNILDYIVSNYPNSTLKHAIKDRAGNYYIVIRLEDGKPLILQFDENGLFVKELDKKHRGHKDHRKHLKKVDVTTLLTVITDYIDLNYPGAEIQKAGQTAKGEFVIFIKVNDKRKALLFDSNGNFIKELK